MARKFNSEGRLKWLAERINHNHQRATERNQKAVNLMATAVCYARTVGNALFRAKRLLEKMARARWTYDGGPAPGYMNWVAANTKLSHRTANDYLRISDPRNWKKIQPHLVSPRPPSIRHALRLVRAAAREETEELPQQPARGKPASREVLRRRARVELRGVVRNWLEHLESQVKHDRREVKDAEVVKDPLLMLAFDPKHRLWNLLEEFARQRIRPDAWVRQPLTPRPGGRIGR